MRISKVDGGNGRTAWTWSSSRLLFALVAALSLLGCDAGKEPYNQGVALEEQGKLVEAAAQYDAVCRRAPDSKLCAPSVTRSAEARLHAAEDLVRAMKFEDASKLLEGVRDSHDDAGRTKANDRLKSLDLVQGLKWEAAQRKPDKRAALVDVEAVGASGAPIAAKAAEWLARERPAILVSQAREACPSDQADCVPTCSKLERLRPGTPEATEANALREAWQQRADARVEQARRDKEKKLYPLRIQAEKLLQQSVQLYAAQKQHERCMVNVMAQPTLGDEVMGAVATCGDGSDLSRRKDKLDDQWRDLLAPLDSGEPLDSLAKRRDVAFENGEYTALKIDKPKE
jgi:hypothetical protein